MEKPEKLVENDVMAWLFTHGFSAEVYDSKATFSVQSGTYKKNRGLKSGTPDILACSPEGYFVALELKAPGKEKVCRIEQHRFLEQKILKNGFGLVLSSVAFLHETWFSWLCLPPEKRQEFLLNLLPKKVLVDGKTISLG